MYQHHSTSTTSTTSIQRFGLHRCTMVHLNELTGDFGATGPGPEPSFPSDSAERNLLRPEGVHQACRMMGGAKKAPPKVKIVKSCQVKTACRNVSCATHCYSVNSVTRWCSTASSCCGTKRSCCGPVYLTCLQHQVSNTLWECGDLPVKKCIDLVRKHVLSELIPD